MMPSIKVSTPGSIAVDEFGAVYKTLLKDDVGRKFAKNINEVQGVEVKTGATNWSTHTYSLEEREAFADWINGRLKDDPDCQQFLVSLQKILLLIKINLKLSKNTLHKT